MIDITELKYDSNGLIPAIITDASDGALLMLGYMNLESLKISIDEGRTCFWSRSRKELWRKGETSGNIQRIVSIKTDCDRDSLVIMVDKAGPACHTGANSCFYEDVFSSGDEPFSRDSLFEIITDRKANRKPGSYTTYLFDKGLDKILKKVGEETTEVIIASKSNDIASAIYEIADLTYHVMVLMAEMGISPDDVFNELKSRHGGKPEGLAPESLVSGSAVPGSSAPESLVSESAATGSTMPGSAMTESETSGGTMTDGRGASVSDAGDAEMRGQQVRDQLVRDQSTRDKKVIWEKE